MTESYHDRLDRQPQLGWRQVLGIFRRSLSYLRPQRTLLLTRLGLVVFIFVAGLPLPWFLKIIVDHGVMQQPIEPDALYPFFMVPFLDAVGGSSPLEITAYALGTLAGVFLLIGYSGNTLLEASLAEGADVATQSENKTSAGTSSAHGLIGLIDLGIAIRLSQRITHHVRSELFGCMSHLPMTSLQVQRSGDAMFRVLHDSPSIAGIANALIVSPFAMVFSVAINLWVLSMVYGSAAPQLVWIGLSAVALTLVATSPLANRMRSVSQASRSSGSAMTDDLEESLRNVAAVQSLGGSALERQKFEGASRESLKRSLLLEWVKSAVNWISENIHLVFQTAGFWVIFTGIVRGELTLGDTPVILRMYSLLYETSMQFGQIWIEQQDNAAAARRVFFMIDRAETAPAQASAGSPHTGQIVGPVREIRYENVSFTYPDGRRALNDVSFTVRAGEVVAIAGATGSGKTTLAYMLPKFLTPTEGRIVVDGTDLAAVAPHEAREHVAFVFQEHQLMTGSVAANLRLARPDATADDMYRACRAAGALDFVTAMPDGLDSRIGRGGGTLSVGQKQRLSIARGLLKDASVLVLDEPTAALDPQTENALMAAITHDDGPSRMRERIVIVIAHRLSTIRNADRILYLHDGSIAELGTYDELMSRPDGMFRRFAYLAV